MNTALCNLWFLDLAIQNAKVRKAAVVYKICMWVALNHGERNPKLCADCMVTCLVVHVHSEWTL